MPQTRRKRTSKVIVQRTREASPPREASPIVAELRVARTRSGRDLRDVAQAARMHPSSLSKIENGHRDPNLSTIQRLCEVLGYEVVVRKKEVQSN